MDMKWNSILPWLIPLALIAGSACIQMYATIDRVALMEFKQRSEGAKAIGELRELQKRVEILERFCCQEVLNNG